MAHLFVVDHSTVQLLQHSCEQTTSNSWSVPGIPTHHVHLSELATASQLRPSLGAAQFHYGRPCAPSTQSLTSQSDILIAWHAVHARSGATRPIPSGVHVPPQSD